MNLISREELRRKPERGDWEEAGYPLTAG